jgi:hypothetical protein
MTKKSACLLLLFCAIGSRVAAEPARGREGPVELPETERKLLERLLRLKLVEGGSEGTA